MSKVLEVNGDKVAMTYKKLREKDYPKKYHDKYLLLLELKPLAFTTIKPFIVKHNVRKKDDNFRLPCVSVLVGSGETRKEVEKLYEKKFSKVEEVIFK